MGCTALNDSSYCNYRTTTPHPLHSCKTTTAFLECCNNGPLLIFRYNSTTRKENCCTTYYCKAVRVGR
eukprot:3205632-Pyramimonas_sp.AAC.1